jgi:hypothetical protein
VFTKDDIRTLVDVVIIDPTRANLFLRSCATQGFDVSDVVQAKERSYHDQHLVNQFLPLPMEVFGCLHKQANVFLHNCANAIWSLKRSEAPSFFFYLSYFSLTKKFSHISKVASILHL